MAKEQLPKIDSRTDEAAPTPEYLSGLACRLRSPLEPIRNSVGLLRSLCTDPRQLQAIDTISSQVVSLTYVLDDMIGASAGGRTAVDPIDEVAPTPSRRILRTLSTALPTRF